MGQSIGSAMNWRHSVLLISALCLTAWLVAGSAHAQTRVGEAVIIQKEVVRVAGSAISQINVGDGLLRDETVRTGLESAARLVMADNTNLSLGPNATLKLDRTVFNDEHTYRDIAVKLTAGAFRFVTGNSEKAAYKITTPLASLRDRRPVHRADAARRYRCYHLHRRQGHDPEGQRPALDLCRELRGAGGTLHRHDFRAGRPRGDAAGR
jgi:hypothetical protein